MSFKSPTQPHCLYCRGKIAKWTSQTYTSVAHKNYRSLADVQRDHNEKVVHVRYADDWVPALDKYGAETIERKKGKVVYSFSTWDGESYVDEFFCNGDHAKRFAYQVARKYFKKGR